MPAKNAASAPWQDLEKQAYHAYREWPIWLALRERELGERGTASRADKRPPQTANAAERTERPPSSAAGKESAE
ncbi:MAG: hypothetical protein IPO91_25610 [Chloroflexi bacterium]|nr:hypothetical protein [Chloroflexota bacterium]